MSTQPLRTVSTAAARTPHDLLVVGPGVLGSRLGMLWKQAHPDARVVGQTTSPANHDRITSQGLEARTTADAPPDERFPYLAFCAPPTGNPDYPGAITSAMALWDGTGAALFSSSAGVYEETAADEDGPVKPMGVSPRNDNLLRAEQAMLDAGGSVVRLVGLYHGQRGAHTYFLRQGTVERAADYVVNLIHYEDAASLCQAVLAARGADGEPAAAGTYLGTDGHPVTFGDMMEATCGAAAFEGRDPVKFTGPSSDEPRKKMNNTATREKLQWQPKYDSFVEFMATTGGEDYFTQSGLFPPM